ncbi:MAG: Ribosomal large subunit pseudouridine synthase C [Chlamydiae bacterium]|nr:Ribosomal large subunit pseudouridine synthase C [Chlamydiota bacterium]
MRLQVGASDTGKTLLAFLRDRLTEYPSVKAVKRAIEAKQCKINGRVETFSTHPVKKGDWVEIHLQLPKKEHAIQLLFQDDDLILVNKPPGKTSESFTEYFLVHRLDKDTSGVILFAKTKKMQHALIDLFRQRKVQKSYLAICDGKIKEKRWVVDNYLEKKVAYQGGSLYGKAPTGKGKRAVTHFHLLQACEIASLVCAEPITGRTHQVRVHLKGRGHPVLGDIQYARHFTCPIHAPRQMLHSHEIRFVHPHTHEEVHCTADPLNDFLQMQKKLFGA